MYLLKNRKNDPEEQRIFGKGMEPWIIGKIQEAVSKGLIVSA
jgi:hypothetical protein